MVIARTRPWRSDSLNLKRQWIGANIQVEIAMQHSTNFSGARIPFDQRPTCTVPEACQAIGLGRTKLYELIGRGKLRTTRIGRRRLVVVGSLLNLVNFDEDNSSTK
jgi:excisionase family DNA binding protein